MQRDEKSNNLFLNPSIMQYEAVLKQEQDNNSKYTEFMQRIEPFKMVSTLAEAKELAAKILPTANELNTFFIGNSKCTVVNNDEMLRICVDSANEFICYSFE